MFFAYTLTDYSMKSQATGTTPNKGQGCSKEEAKG